MADGNEGGKRPRTPRKNPSPRKRQCTYNIFTPATSPERIPQNADDEGDADPSQQELVSDAASDGSVRRSPRKVPKEKVGSDASEIPTKSEKKRKHVTSKKSPSKGGSKNKKKGKMAKVKASIAKMEAKIAKMRKNLGVQSTDIQSTDSQTDVKVKGEKLLITDTGTPPMVETNISCGVKSDTSSELIVTPKCVSPRRKSSIHCSGSSKAGSPHTSQNVSQKLKCLGASNDLTDLKETTEIATKMVMGHSDVNKETHEASLLPSQKTIEEEASPAARIKVNEGKSPNLQVQKSRKSPRKKPLEVECDTKSPKRQEDITRNITSPKRAAIKSSGNTSPSPLKHKPSIYTQDTSAKDVETSEQEKTQNDSVTMKLPGTAQDNLPATRNDSPKQKSPSQPSKGKSTSKKGVKSQVSTEKTDLNPLRYTERKDMQPDSLKASVSNDNKVEQQNISNLKDATIVSDAFSEQNVSPDACEIEDEPRDKSAWKSPSGKTPKFPPTSRCTARILRKSVEKVRRRVVFSPDNKKSVRRLMACSPERKRIPKTKHPPLKKKELPVASNSEVAWVDADMQPISEDEDEKPTEPQIIGSNSQHLKESQVGSTSSTQKAVLESGLNTSTEVRFSRRLAIKRKLKLKGEPSGNDDDEEDAGTKRHSHKKSDLKDTGKTKGKGARKKNSRSKSPEETPIDDVSENAPDEESKINESPLSKDKKAFKKSKRSVERRTKKAARHLRKNTDSANNNGAEQSQKAITEESLETSPCIKEEYAASVTDPGNTGGAFEVKHEEGQIDVACESMDSQSGSQTHNPGFIETSAEEIDSLARVLLSLNEDSQHLQIPSKDANILSSPPSTPKKRTPRKTPLKINFRFRTPPKTSPKAQQSLSKVETTSRSPARFVGRFSSDVKGSPLAFHDDHHADRLPSPTKIERLTCSGIEVLDTQASECNPAVDPQPSTSGEQTSSETKRRPIRRSLNLGISPKIRNSSRKRKNTKRKHFGKTSGKLLKKVSSREVERPRVEVADSPQSSGLQIVEDDDDSDWEDETDEILEAHAQAQPIRLTATNVRTIIKEVITHSGVIDMMTNTLMEIGLKDKLKEAIFEPKLTRSHVKKKLMEKGAIPGIWPLASIEGTKTGPSKSFTELTFSDDDEDDDYDPLNDYDQLNELSDADSESILSSRASDFGSPRSQAASIPSLSSPPKLQIQPIAAPNTPVEEPPLPYRLRSKMSLEDTKLEEIEANFVAPDITADMYDTVCDDKDWMTFLNTLYKTEPEPEMNDTYDEKNDPEYNIMEELEDEDNEDYRNDKAVKVTQKEINDLCAELCDFDFPDLDDQDLLDISRGPKEKDTEAEVPSKLVYKPKVPPIVLDTPASIILVNDMSKLQDISANEKVEPIRAAATKDSKTLKFTCDDEYIQLQDQMRKHVQLLAQTYVLADTLIYENVRQEAITMLNELQQFGLSQSIHYGKPSFFHAINLDGAFAIAQRKPPDVQNENLQRYVHAALRKKHWKRSIGQTQKIALTWPQMDVFCTDKTFLFPQMLPETRFFEKDKLPSFQIFTEAEDTLIALGLHQFSKVGPLGQAAEMIKTYLLPVKTSTKILNRIKRLKYGTCDNPVKEYYKSKKVPELETYKELEGVEDICAPEEREPSCMPSWFQAYASVKKRYFNGKINMKYNPETRELESDNDRLDDEILEENLEESYTGKPTTTACQTRRSSSRREAIKMARESAKEKATGPYPLLPSTSYYAIPTSEVPSSNIPPAIVSATTTLPYIQGPMVVISSQELEEYGAQLISSPGPIVVPGTASGNTGVATSTPRRPRTTSMLTDLPNDLGKISADLFSEEVLNQDEMTLRTDSSAVTPAVIITSGQNFASPVHTAQSTHSIASTPAQGNAMTQSRGLALPKTPVHPSAETLTVVSSIRKHPVMSPSQVSVMSPTPVAAPVHPLGAPNSSTAIVQVVSSPVQSVMSPAPAAVFTSPGNKTLNPSMPSTPSVALPLVKTVLSPAQIVMSPVVNVMSPVQTIAAPPPAVASGLLHPLTPTQTSKTSLTSGATPHSSPAPLAENEISSPVINVETSDELGSDQTNPVQVSVSASPQCSTSLNERAFPVSQPGATPVITSQTVASMAAPSDTTEAQPRLGETEKTVGALSPVSSPFKTPNKPKVDDGLSHLSPANILLTGGIKSVKVRTGEGPDLEDGSTILESCQLQMEPCNSTEFNESTDKSPDESDLSGYVMETPKKFIPNEECSRSPTVYSNSSFSNSPGYSDCTPTKRDFDTPTKSAVEIMAAFADCINSPVRHPPRLTNTPSPLRRALLTPDKLKSPFRFGMKLTPIKFRSIIPKGDPMTPPKALSPLPKKVAKSPRRRILQQKARAILPKGFVASTYATSPTKKAAASLTRRARTLSGFRKIRARPPANKPKSDETDDVLATADENEDTDIDVLETDPASEYDTLESEYASEDNQSADEKENNEKAVVVKAPAAAPPKPKRQRRWKKKPKKKAEYNDSASDNEDTFGMGMRFGHDSQDEADEVDPFAQFMAASTTIRFDPKRSSSTSDGQIKSKSKLKREMTLHMLAPDLIASDVMRDERDTAFAKAYLANALEVLSDNKETLEKFLQIMYSFGKSDKTPVDLHKEVQEVLCDYPGLIEGFSGFLLPEQALECGCYLSNEEFNRGRLFLRKLEVYFSKHPSHLQKIYRILSTWGKREKEGMDNKEFRDQVIPLLRGQQHLVDEFTKLISSEKPVQHTHNADFEEVTIPDDDDSRELPPPEADIEDVVLGESVEDTLYGTSRCKCHCHAVSDKFFSHRRKHCDNCSKTIIRGKLYMQTMEKTLRPVQVQFVGCPPKTRAQTQGEEDGGQKDEGISSDEEAYRDPTIDADTDVAPPAKKRRRIKGPSLKVKLIGKKTNEQAVVETPSPQVEGPVPIMEVAQDSILVPDTTVKGSDGDNTSQPTDFSQLRQELLSERNTGESELNNIGDSCGEKPLPPETKYSGSKDAITAQNLIVETSLMGMETPLKLRPMMRIASKDIRMTQVPSDVENSNSNSNSQSEHSNSNSHGSAQSNDVPSCASRISKNSANNDDSNTSKPSSELPTHVDVDETANMGIETSKEPSSNKDPERILLKLNIISNESSESGSSKSDTSREDMQDLPEESSNPFKLSDSKISEPVIVSICVKERDSNSEELSIEEKSSSNEKLTDTEQSDVKEQSDKTDWTQDEDKEILLTCKESKVSKEIFEKISQNLSSHPTPSQVEKRFTELMNLFEHDTSITSCETSSEEEEEGES